MTLVNQRKGLIRSSVDVKLVQLTVLLKPSLKKIKLIVEKKGVRIRSFSYFYLSRLSVLFCRVNII